MKVLPVDPTDPDRTTRYADFEYVEVCTDGAGSADFNATHLEKNLPPAQSLDFTLAANGCRDVVLTSQGDGDAVTTEVATPAGFQFDSIVVHIAPKNVDGVK